MMEEKPKEKKKIDWKAPRTKAFFFFGFYAIFFLVVGALFLGGKSPQTPMETSPFFLTKIQAGNYAFTYTVKENGIMTVDQGKRSQNMTLFTRGEQELFIIREGKFYQQIGGDYKEVKDVYRYPYFFDIKELNRILKNSTYLSKTEYQDDSISYQYGITSNSLISLFQNKEVDIDVPQNTITLFVKEKATYKIVLDITSYASYQDSNMTDYEITLEYTDFGSVEELVIPE